MFYPESYPRGGAEPGCGEVLKNQGEIEFGIVLFPGDGPDRFDKDRVKRRYLLYNVRFSANAGLVKNSGVFVLSPDRGQRFFSDIVEITEKHFF